MKTVQYLSREYVDQTRHMTPEQILQFLEEFRLLHGSEKQSKPVKSKLISLKVPENLLEQFRQRCAQEGVPYQTQIKKLMQQYL